MSLIINRNWLNGYNFNANAIIDEEDENNFGNLLFGNDNLNLFNDIRINNYQGNWREFGALDSSFTINTSYQNVTSKVFFKFTLVKDGITQVFQGVSGQNGMKAEEQFYQYLVSIGMEGIRIGSRPTSTMASKSGNVYSQEHKLYILDGDIAKLNQLLDVGDSLKIETRIEYGYLNSNNQFYVFSNNNEASKWSSLTIEGTAYNGEVIPPIEDPNITEVYDYNDHSLLINNIANVYVKEDELIYSANTPNPLGGLFSFNYVDNDTSANGVSSLDRISKIEIKGAGVYSSIIANHINSSSSGNFNWNPSSKLSGEYYIEYNQNLQRFEMHLTEKGYQKLREIQNGEQGTLEFLITVKDENGNVDQTPAKIIVNVNGQYSNPTIVALDPYPNDSSQLANNKITYLERDDDLTDGDTGLYLQTPGTEAQGGARRIIAEYNVGNLANNGNLEPEAKINLYVFNQLKQEFELGNHYTLSKTKNSDNTWNIKVLLTKEGEKYLRNDNTGVGSSNKEFKFELQVKDATSGEIGVGFVNVEVTPVSNSISTFEALSSPITFISSLTSGSTEIQELQLQSNGSFIGAIKVTDIDKIDKIENVKIEATGVFANQLSLIEGSLFGNDGDYSILRSLFENFDKNQNIGFLLKKDGVKKIKDLIGDNEKLTLKLSFDVIDYNGAKRTFNHNLIINGDSLPEVTVDGNEDNNFNSFEFSQVNEDDAKISPNGILAKVKFFDKGGDASTLSASFQLSQGSEVYDNNGNLVNLDLQFETDFKLEATSGGSGNVTKFYNLVLTQSGYDKLFAYLQYNQGVELEFRVWATENSGGNSNQALLRINILDVNLPIKIEVYNSTNSDNNQIDALDIALDETTGVIGTIKEDEIENFVATIRLSDADNALPANLSADAITITVGNNSITINNDNDEITLDKIFSNSDPYSALYSLNLNVGVRAQIRDLLTLVNSNKEKDINFKITFSGNKFQTQTKEFTLKVQAINEAPFIIEETSTTQINSYDIANFDPATNTLGKWTIKDLDGNLNLFALNEDGFIAFNNDVSNSAWWQNNSQRSRLGLEVKVDNVLIPFSELKNYFDLKITLIKGDFVVTNNSGDLISNIDDEYNFELKFKDLTSYNNFVAQKLGGVNFTGNKNLSIKLITRDIGNGGGSSSATTKLFSDLVEKTITFTNSTPTLELDGNYNIQNGVIVIEENDFDSLTNADGEVLLAAFKANDDDELASFNSEIINFANTTGTIKATFAIASLPSTLSNLSQSTTFTTQDIIFDSSHYVIEYIAGSSSNEGRIEVRLTNDGKLFLDKELNRRNASDYEAISFDVKLSVQDEQGNIKEVTQKIRINGGNDEVVLLASESSPTNKDISLINQNTEITFFRFADYDNNYILSSPQPVLSVKTASGLDITNFFTLTQVQFSGTGITNNPITPREFKFALKFKNLAEYNNFNAQYLADGFESIFTEISITDNLGAKATHAAQINFSNQVIDPNATTFIYNTGNTPNNNVAFLDDDLIPANRVVAEVIANDNDGILAVDIVPSSFSAVMEDGEDISNFFETQITNNIVRILVKAEKVSELKNKVVTGNKLFVNFETRALDDDGNITNSDLVQLTISEDGNSLVGGGGNGSGGFMLISSSSSVEFIDLTPNQADLIDEDITLDKDIEKFEVTGNIQSSSVNIFSAKLNGVEYKDLFKIEQISPSIQQYIVKVKDANSLATLKNIITAQNQKIEFIFKATEFTSGLPVTQSDVFDVIFDDASNTNQAPVWGEIQNVNDLDTNDFVVEINETDFTSSLFNLFSINLSDDNAVQLQDIELVDGKIEFDLGGGVIKTFNHSSNDFNVSFSTQNNSAFINFSNFRASIVNEIKNEIDTGETAIAKFTMKYTDASGAVSEKEYTIRINGEGSSTQNQAPVFDEVIILGDTNNDKFIIDTTTQTLIDNASANNNWNKFFEVKVSDDANFNGSIIGVVNNVEFKDSNGVVIATFNYPTDFNSNSSLSSSGGVFNSTISAWLTSDGRAKLNALPLSTPMQAVVNMTYTDSGTPAQTATQLFTINLNGFSNPPSNQVPVINVDNTGLTIDFNERVRNDNDNSKTLDDSDVISKFSIIDSDNPNATYSNSDFVISLFDGASNLTANLGSNWFDVINSSSNNYELKLSQTAIDYLKTQVGIGQTKNFELKIQVKDKVDNTILSTVKTSIFSLTDNNMKFPVDIFSDNNIGDFVSGINESALPSNPNATDKFKFFEVKIEDADFTNQAITDATLASSSATVNLVNISNASQSISLVKGTDYEVITVFDSNGNGRVVGNLLQSGINKIKAETWLNNNVTAEGTLNIQLNDGGLFTGKNIKLSIKGSDLVVNPVDTIATNTIGNIAINEGDISINNNYKLGSFTVTDPDGIVSVTLDSSKISFGANPTNLVASDFILIQVGNSNEYEIRIQPSAYSKITALNNNQNPVVTFANGAIIMVTKDGANLNGANITSLSNQFTLTINGETPNNPVSFTDNFNDGVGGIYGNTGVVGDFTSNIKEDLLSAGASIIAEVIITDADLNTVGDLNAKLVAAGFDDSEITLNGNGGSITLSKALNEFDISKHFIGNNQFKLQVVLMPDGFQKISSLQSLNDNTSISGIFKIKIADGLNNSVIEKDINIVIEGKTNVVDTPPTIILDGFADGVNSKTINEANLNASGDTILGKINISDDNGFFIIPNTNIPGITANLSFDANGNNINLIENIHYEVSQLMGTGNNRYFEIILKEAGKNLLAPLLNSGQSIKINALIDALDNAPNGGNSSSENFEFVIEGVNSPANNAPVISNNPSANINEDNLTTGFTLHTWNITDANANDNITITLNAISGNGFNFLAGKTFNDYFELVQTQLANNNKSVALKIKQNANINEVKKLLNLGDTGTINFTITASDGNLTTTRDAEIKIDGKGMDLEIRDITSDFISTPLDDVNLDTNTSIIEFSVRDDSPIINPAVTLKIQGAATFIPTNLYSVVFVQDNNNLPDYYEKQYKVVFNQNGVNFIKNNISPSQLKDLEIKITASNGNANPALLEIDEETLSIEVTDSSPASSSWVHFGGYNTFLPTVNVDSTFDGTYHIHHREIVLKDFMADSSNFVGTNNGGIAWLMNFVLDDTDGSNKDGKVIIKHHIGNHQIDGNINFSSSYLQQFWSGYSGWNGGQGFGNDGSNINVLEVANGFHKNKLTDIYNAMKAMSGNQYITFEYEIEYYNQMSGVNGETQKHKFQITLHENSATSNSSYNPNSITLDEYVGFADLNDQDGLSFANDNLDSDGLNVASAEEVTNNGFYNVLKQGSNEADVTLVTFATNNGQDIQSVSLPTSVTLQTSNNQSFALVKGSHFQLNSLGELILTKTGADFLATKITGANTASGALNFSVTTETGEVINATYNLKFSNLNIAVNDDSVNGVNANQAQSDFIFEAIGNDFRIEDSTGNQVIISTDDNTSLEYNASLDTFVYHHNDI